LLYIWHLGFKEESSHRAHRHNGSMHSLATWLPHVLRARWVLLARDEGQEAARVRRLAHCFLLLQAWAALY